jgi:hypothetical protein
MNVIMKIDQFNDKNIFFQERIKNNVIDDSSFIRIIYSNKIFTLNCIIIEFKLLISQTESYFNKYKYFFNTYIPINKDIIILLCAIEKNILNKLSLINKTPIYRLYENIYSGNIKLFNDDNVTKDSDYSANNKLFYLKISGIWENAREYGLTYKFIRAAPPTSTALPTTTASITT